MTSSFLYIPNLSEEPAHAVTDPAIHQPFSLDPFQRHSIAAIDQGHNVLVCAKTGSGKTLVGEYQIAHSLRQGKRVFQTTPIKSLSNQKFHDLKQMQPEPGFVGILTGDIKFCPDARIIVMTTEILRNLLYKVGTSTEHVGLTSCLSVKNLGAVIFDECHYINDPDRGKVWEETMIRLPSSVQMILLSATLDHPEQFAAWLGELKQVPMHLIQTGQRIVPLQHQVLVGNQFHTIFDPKEVYNEGVQKSWLQGATQQIKDHEDQQRKVANARRAGIEGAIDGKSRPAKFTHRWNELVDLLQEKELLPALAFSLSRKNCESLAAKVQTDLLDSSDATKATHIFDFHLRNHKELLETIPQQQTLRNLIQKGVAQHHSGLLPVLKEIIEILFSKGLVRLLVCTETFAVGLNMPTKTVIFTGLEKYDDNVEGMRVLRTDEQIQMAGRAGRRGKDTQGHVIQFPEREPIGVAEMRSLLKGTTPGVKSRMDFHYDFLLKTIQKGDLRFFDVIEKSQWQRQWETALAGDQKELRDAEESLDNQPLSVAEREAFAEKEEIEEAVRSSTNAARRNAQRRLEQWNNTHLGPKWHNASLAWKKCKEIQREIETLKTSIQSQQDYFKAIDFNFDFLEKAGYVEPAVSEQEKVPHLTRKGTLATEFNECHPILATELFVSQEVRSLAGEELAAVLSFFITDTKGPDDGGNGMGRNISDPIHQTWGFLKDRVKALIRMEDATRSESPNSQWELSALWVEPLLRWIAGDHPSAICGDCGIQEGNFVRTILRIANCVDEWIAVAQLCEDLEMVEKLVEVRPKLVRDIVTPQSLQLSLN